MIKSYSLRRKVANAIVYTVLTIMGIIWILPIVYLIINSFDAATGAYHSYIIPPEFTFDNYVRLFTETDQFNYPKWFMNTFIIAIISCVLSTLYVLMVSYTFSRLRFKSRKLLMNISMILGMFPGFMTMIAVYYLLKTIGLTQPSTQHVALVLVYSGGAGLGYFISKGFFDTIPRSLDEAATIDGATKNQIFWKIILPMSKPIIVYTVLTSFISPWVDYIFVSIIVRDQYDNYTVAIGLKKMLEREFISRYWTRFCAGAVIVSIPITILFCCMQKYYVSGVTAGGVKG